MTAYDSLERRILNLSLANAQDSGEAVVVIGLHTSAPPETADGAYGIAGEPVNSALYRRQRVSFGPSTTVNGVRQVTNTEPVTITGLTPGTYTHFSVYGSTSGGTTG